MKILVIGSGGREHALVHTFVRQGHQVYCLPGNAGIQMISSPIAKEWTNLDINDFSKLADFVKEFSVDLTVVGPELPLSNAIADYFVSQGLLLFGPEKNAARLESSKAWAKQFMAKYNIPTARFVVCRNSNEAKISAENFFSDWNGIVVKPNGLTGGKGVVCCSSLLDAKKAISESMDALQYGNAGSEIVLEELLDGKELSVLAFSDGVNIFPMIPSQDHKRLYDNDEGPNTGGVGAYAPTPFATKALMDEITQSIIEPTRNGLQAEGIMYKGVLYFGLMLTKNGPKVLEYNCRFGDPETQAILPLLDSDLAQIMLNCCKGRLNQSDIRWKSLASCCVVMVSEGYPYAFSKGHEIYGLDQFKDCDDILIFHAGTERNEQGKIISHGGRVLGVTGIGHDLKNAISKAYQGMHKISFDGAYYRKDIARQAFIEEDMTLNVGASV